MTNRVRLFAVLLLGSSALGTVPSEAQEFSARSGSSVVLGARAQIQYETTGEEGVPGTFFIRRAWVTIDGSLNEHVGGRVQFNAQGSSVLEAYLELKPSEAFQVQIGQFKRAMSYFWLAANADLPLIERDGRVTGVDHCPGVGGVCSFGQFTGSLGLDNYEPGILMTGRFAERRMGYRVTVTNGEGLSRKDVNTRKSVSAFGLRRAGRDPQLGRGDARRARVRRGAADRHMAPGSASARQRPARTQLEAQRRRRLLGASAHGPVVSTAAGRLGSGRVGTAAANKLG